MFNPAVLLATFLYLAALIGALLALGVWASSAAPPRRRPHPRTGVGHAGRPGGA